MPKRGPQRRPPAHKRSSGSKAGGFRGTGKGGGPRQPRGAVYRPSENAQVVGVEAGGDLAHFLHDNLPGKWSVRAVRRFLAEGKVRVDGQIETFGSRRLKRGEVVDYVLPDNDRRPTRFEPRRLLYDEGGLVAYDKPPGLAVTPPEDGKSWHLQKLLADAIGDVLPVHRLDADTSGVVLMARDKQWAEALEEMFREHRVKKTYLAIVRGHPKEEGRRQSYLICQERQPGFERWGSGRGPDAREAITEWGLKERLGAYGSLMQVEPKTGRHHQIRIHFSEMGHPLYGDRLYGDRRDPVPVPRQMLHAAEVVLPDPLGGQKPIRIKAPLPKDMAELKKGLMAIRE